MVVVPLGRLLPRAAAVLVAALALLIPRAVDACSCRRSPPRNEFVVGASATLPRDALGIPWDGDSLRPYPSDAPPRVTSLARWIEGSSVAVPFTIEERGFSFIVPEGGLVPGARYTATVDFAAIHRSITVTIAPESIPLADVTLSLSARRLAGVAVPGRDPGECSEEVRADVVEATAALPPAIERYREYLLYTFLVDGKRYDGPPVSHCSRPWGPRGRSRRADPGREVLFTVCDEDFGLAPGTHQVALEIATPEGRRHRTGAETFTIDCATSPPLPVAAEPASESAASTAESAASAGPEATGASGGPPPVAKGCSIGADAAAEALLLLLVALGRSRRARRRGSSSVE
ncbi:MAG: hypothetical protein R3B09_09360 [Nannocystaceae bacterium]